MTDTRPKIDMRSDAMREIKELRFADGVIGGPKVRAGYRKIGMPVRIRVCGDDSKTYDGVYLGDLPTSLGTMIERNENGEMLMAFSPTSYNPAIFVPELSQIYYGYESWWGEAKAEKKMEITDAAS